MSRKLRARLVFRTAGVVESNVTLIEYGATWKYLQGANGHELGFEDPDYDDSAWDSGPAAFGYVLEGTQLIGPLSPPCIMNRELVETEWDVGTDMLLRKVVTVPVGTRRLHFEFGADNQAYIYVD